MFFCMPAYVVSSGARLLDQCVCHYFVSLSVVVVTAPFYLLQSTSYDGTKNRAAPPTR